MNFLNFPRFHERFISDKTEVGLVSTLIKNNLVYYATCVGVDSKILEAYIEGLEKSGLEITKTEKTFPIYEVNYRFHFFRIVDKGVPVFYLAFVPRLNIAFVLDLNGDSKPFFTSTERGIDIFGEEVKFSMAFAKGNNFSSERLLGLLGAVVKTHVMKSQEKVVTNEIPAVIGKSFYFDACHDALYFDCEFETVIKSGGANKFYASRHYDTKTCQGIFKYKDKYGLVSHEDGKSSVVFI